AEWGDHKGNVSLNALDLDVPSVSLKLSKPASIGFAKQTKSASSRWNLDIFPQFQWHGDESDLAVAASVEWPARGHISISAHNFSSTICQTFLTRPLPSLRLIALRGKGDWKNDPLEFSMNSEFQFYPLEQLDSVTNSRPFNASLQVSGTAKG